MIEYNGRKLTPRRYAAEILAEVVCMRAANFIDRQCGELDGMTEGEIQRVDTMVRKGAVRVLKALGIPASRLEISEEDYEDGVWHS